jgi:hypothetical protein
VKECGDTKVEKLPVIYFGNSSVIAASFQHYS